MSKTQLAEAIHSTYYDPEQDRMIFPEPVTAIRPIMGDYNAIYDGCQEDMEKAFGQDLPGSLLKLTDLDEDMKKDILKKLKTKLNDVPKWANCEIQNKSGGIVPFAEEFERVLEAITFSECFHIECPVTGVIRGLEFPTSINVQVGLAQVPWKFLNIDFAAQRFTDVYHIVEKMLNYDSKRNLGLTGRFATNGQEVDINDGRHSAILLALTGIPYALVRGPVCDSRTTNMNTFEVLNSLAKVIKFYDEINFIYNRALIEKDEGGIDSIDNQKRQTGSKKRLSDRQIYEMYELAKKYGISLVSPQSGSNNRRHIEAGEWFRVDQLFDFIDNKNYTTYDKATGKITDTWLYDSLAVLRDTVIDYGGYAPHEPSWAMNELFYQTNRENPLTDSDRKKMRKALSTALMEFLPAVNMSATRDMAKNRPYEFYLEWNRLVNKRIPDSWNLKELAKNKRYINVFLATVMYSLVQECKAIKQPIKALFVQPTLTRTIMDDDGKDVTETIPVMDDRGLPLSYTYSFRSNTKSIVEAVEVVEDEELEYV